MTPLGSTCLRPCVDGYGINVVMERGVRNEETLLLEVVNAMHTKCLIKKTKRPKYEDILLIMVQLNYVNVD